MSVLSARPAGMKVTARGAYTTYRFTSRDHRTFREVSDSSGVSDSTLRSWARGRTRRPQFATVMAVLRACGRDLKITSGGSRK